MKLSEYDQKMIDALFIDYLPQYVDGDVLQNGIQSWGKESVEKVGFAVSASMAVFEKAVEAGCDVLVVHHGIFPTKRMDPFTWNRWEFLAQNDLTLWSAHYVLDAHPRLGNNAQILKTIGVDVFEPYADFSGAPWGHMGDLSEPVSVEEIVNRLGDKISPDSIIYNFGSEKISRVAVVSGKGAPNSFGDLMDLRDKGVELYITGEVHEYNREMFREAGIALIGGGHYHTEVFGVRALQAFTESEWGLETVWIDHVNNV